MLSLILVDLILILNHWNDRCEMCSVMGVL